MTYKICIDIGGTFTDCLVEDSQGARHIFKAPTTPGVFQNGFMNAIGKAAEGFGFEIGAFLDQVDRIVHGSTVSTNALVEGKVAKTGYLCNAGHLDVLTIREALPKPVFEWRLDYPDPYVPRSRTFGVAGRMTATGDEIEPLDEAAVADAVTAMKAADVEAIAVSYLWSIANPAHELRTREIIREIWPEVPVTLGHELNPIGREYRRTIAAVTDASLQPIVSRYVSALTGALKDAGWDGELLLANCVGGMMPPEDLIRQPIYSVMSGPTLAPVAAQQLMPGQSVIVADMGGTTFDVSALRDGALVVSPEARIGHDMLGISKIDVRSVGAGGGSIARLDAGGMLRVGPESASAVPGPACYMRGGTKPTITDANLVMGLLDPDQFLGGTMPLDKEAAIAVLTPLAEEMGVSLEEAAHAIYTTSNNAMVGLINDMTVKEGIDPRDSSIVVGGGATALHIAEIARELGIREVLIPRFAAGLSAFGGLISDIRREETATLMQSSEAFDADRVTEALMSLQAQGKAFLDAAGVAEKQHRFEFIFLGRYRYQSWEIEVPFTLTDAGLTEADLERLVKAFHDMHERIYSVRMDEDVVEFTTWKVRVTGECAEKIAPAGKVPSETKEATVRQKRPLYLYSAGAKVECPVHMGGDLIAGDMIEGPALIEEPTTTIYVPEGVSITLDTESNYLMRVG
ncbi:hydantoinase/oxoprolinase family protein [Celeribacter litoreus]|uniref:hydantoinase/oxoprolinase family protein n=1 Tax=Celeribacter litoreus TaxID=2876714 RepID=UPI001CCDEC18|nr:hydantoinase/oxoprolinase family protein [Celeribacter litoreus]MCA0042506.1 hydantoinase/oxoprolinase family protein [Celeribacter litoreus]